MAALHKAYRLAIRQTADALVDSKIEYLLADGYKIPRIKGLPRSLQIDIVGGDGISLSIAAASIIAKEYRDGLMKKWAQKYRQYGWETNVGYGTRQHREAIARYGMCRLHRLQYVQTGLQKIGKMRLC